MLATSSVVGLMHLSGGHVFVCSHKPSAALWDGREREDSDG